MRLPALIGLLFACTVTKAQQYDAQWVTGPLTSVLDFRNSDTVELYTVPGAMPMTITEADICDEAGNFLYFTNGIYIADKNGNSIANGSGLSPCAFTSAWADQGLPIYEGALFLPQPGSTRYYLLFHYSNDTLQDDRPGTLYYSIIDKEGNSGQGEVIEKNIVFCKGEFREGGMTACKHANGRDWWVVMGESNNNVFDKFLVTPDSVLGPFTQAIGPVFALPDDLAYTRFSQDGSKFAAGAVAGYVLVMDFDRCTGEFSNPNNIFNLSRETPPASGSVAQEFSPNNRFLYVSDNINLNQYDLWSVNGQDSIEVYRADSSDNVHIAEIQLAPNGKIYGATWAGGYYFFHVVNNPDEKGDSCGFVFGGQPTLSINSASLPTMVNYNLGALVGSGCDTITAGFVEPPITRQLYIHPNPADKYVYCEMPIQGNFEFLLLNSTGQLIDKRQTPQIDIFDTENLPAGMYFILAIDRQTGAQMAAQRVTVVH